jgi:ABC-2 type transport system permease protein
MTVFRHEMRRGRLALIVWTGAIGFLMAVCIGLFPEMKDQMGEISGMFASMGSFTQAFGMDRLQFGTLLGFYGIECGNILGLGGAFFAALAGIGALAREEKDRTAEFLLTHPVSRASVVVQKFLSVLAQVAVLNICALAVALAMIALIGETVEMKKLLLIHAAYFAMQVEIASVCFGLSAFMRTNALGVGLGLATGLYFLNLIANIAPSAEALKWITPFGYAETADIVEAGRIQGEKLALGMGIGAAFFLAGLAHYLRKDIA